MKTAIFICAQLFGFLYFLLDFLSVRQSSRKGTLKYNALSNVAAICEYGLLGAWNGLVCCSIALLRNAVFSRYKKVPLWILITYIVIAIGTNVTFIDSIIDILPVLNIILVALAFSEENMVKLKTLWLITCFLSIAYDITHEAFVSFVFGLINLFPLAWFVIKYNLDKNKKKA